VKVLWPGFATPAVRLTPLRRAEGKEKGKGVVARRGLEGGSGVSRSKLLLEAGVSVGGQVVPTHLGVPPGGTTQPCATVGIQFIEPRIRDPYVRWCGREGREASSCLDQA